MAHHGNGSSLSELERQTESTRAELIQTVDELQSRVSPQALKRDAKDYVRQSSRNFLQTVESKAMENPIAAVAVAAGLALPALRIVSSIPVPVLLIGAGLAMTRKGAGESGISYRSSTRWDDQSGGSIGEKVSDAARSVTDKAGQVLEDTQHKVEDVGARVKDAVKEKAEAARTMASDAATTLSETATDLSHRTSRAMSRTQREVLHTIDRQPLVVGGIVFALGGLLASLLPKSRPEDRLMGQASDRIKHRARDVAEEGADTLKSAAGEVFSATAQKVQNEGLTPDVARHAVRDVIDHASGAADKAVSLVEPKSTSTRPM